MLPSGSCSSSAAVTELYGHLCVCVCNGSERAVECIHKLVTAFAEILKGGGDNEPCYLGLKRGEREQSVVMSHDLNHPLMFALP